MISHWIIIPFLFLLGASIGSFLNVVVYRLPRGKSLLWPPSACPKCGHGLSPRDNIPVFGWLFLGGKCRYCREPISARYPIIEAITGLLFVFYYAAIFIGGWGPYLLSYDAFGVPEYTTLLSLEHDWAIYGLIMFMVCSLLVASLIDAEMFIIPIEIPWTLALVAFLVHALIARPQQVGALTAGPVTGAWSIGIAAGLLLSNLLLRLKFLRRSFDQGEPMLEVERKQLEEQLKAQNASAEDFAQLPPVASRGEIRRQILLEMLFLIPPLLLAAAAAYLAIGQKPSAVWWAQLLQNNSWLDGLLGSLFGAIIAAATIWVTRILATFTLGRVAMGQGDTHLMFGIGAVIGAGPSVLVFFLAPFCGLLIAVYGWLRKGARELPYGPYLSFAACVVILVYRYFAEYFRQPMEAIAAMLMG